MVAKIKQSVLQSSQDIIWANRVRNTKFEGMDELFYNLQQKPKELEGEKWFRLVPSTQASDSVWGAVRTLSTIEPGLTFAPIGLKDADRERADKIERVLTALYRLSGRRSRNNHTRQMVLTAVLYDMIALQMDFVPLMLKNKNISPKLRKRLERSKRHGPFALHVHNPKNVHPIHSEWGLERVVLEQVMEANAAVAYFENAKLENMVKSEKSDFVYVMDSTDEEMRYITAHPMATGMLVPTENLQIKDTITIVNEAHELPFIPWVVKGGGATTETLPELHYRPLLDSIYKTGQAKTATLLRSLLISDIITNYFTPNTKSVTQTGEAPDIEQKGPRGNAELMVGEDFGMLPPSIMDVGMLGLLQLIEDDMQRSTAPRILFGEVPSDISFATYNAGVQSASRTIIPYKELGEEALSGVFTQMLLYAEYAQEDLTAFISLASSDGGVSRETFTIGWNEFDTDTIDIAVELKADVAVDRQAKINAGVMLHQNLPVSAEYTLDQIGIEDTTAVMERRQQEDLNNVAHQNVMFEMSSEQQEAVMAQARELAMAEIAQQAQSQEQSQEQNQPRQPSTQ